MALLAVGGATINSLIAHGVLRPMLEARGISPWTVRDTLGSTPLVLLGSALVSGAVGLLILRMVLGAGGATCEWSAWVIAAAVVAMGIGALMIRLGLLALRKLL